MKDSILALVIGLYGGLTCLITSQPMFRRWRLCLWCQSRRCSGRRQRWRRSRVEDVLVFLVESAETERFERHWKRLEIWARPRRSFLGRLDRVCRVEEHVSEASVARRRNTFVSWRDERARKSAREGRRGRCCRCCSCRKSSGSKTRSRPIATRRV